jgi:hypothetical protein
MPAQFSQTHHQEEIDMNEQHDANVNENSPAQENEASSTQQVTDAAPAADEFRLVIKKLDLPVRPRGVLADG